MTFLMALLVCVASWASQYAPGVMQSVIRTRQAGLTAHSLPRQLPDVNGYIAVSDCNEIGNIWAIEHNHIPENFLVTDCAGSQPTRSWMSQNNITVEVDFETALRWNTVHYGARICRTPPAQTRSRNY